MVETFELVGRDGRVTSQQEEGEKPSKPQTHFFTFESDFVREGGGEASLDWMVTNINDAICSPSLNSLLLLCGGSATTASASN